MLGDSLVRAVLADYRSAPIDNRLRAMLGYLEKQALTPEEIGPPDVAILRQAGIGDQAILDAVDVSVAFHTINRVADATGFTLQDERGYAASATMLLKRGYKI